MASKVNKAAKKTKSDKLKTKKVTLKSTGKSSKKAKSAKPVTKTKVKAKAEPKKAAATKKSSSKTSAKKTTAKKVSSKKVASKGKKGFLNQIVSKLTSTSKAPAPKSSKAASEKGSSKVSAKSKVKAVELESKDSAQDVATEKKKALKEVKSVKVVEEAKSSQKNIAELTQEFTEKKTATEVFLTDAEGRVLCKFSGCDEISTVEGYCRYHYLLNWKRIQLKKKILSEGKLEKYINELTAKYPDKYIDMLKNDLKTEKDFLSVVNELEIDDTDNSMSDDEEDSYIEQEVQGVSGGGKRSNEEDY